MIPTSDPAYAALKEESVRYSVFMDKLEAIERSKDPNAGSSDVPEKDWDMRMAVYNSTSMMDCRVTDLPTEEFAVCTTNLRNLMINELDKYTVI